MHTQLLTEMSMEPHWPVQDLLKSHSYKIRCGMQVIQCQYLKGIGVNLSFRLDFPYIKHLVPKLVQHSFMKSINKKLQFQAQKHASDPKSSFKIISNSSALVPQVAIHSPVHSHLKLLRPGNNSLPETTSSTILDFGAPQKIQYFQHTLFPMLHNYRS